jgi:hypothetical protein
MEKTGMKEKVKKLFGDRCPKCGLKGSLQTKVIPSNNRNYTYPYFAHYDSKKKGNKWCYISRNLLSKLEETNKDLRKHEVNLQSIP